MNNLFPYVINLVIGFYRLLLPGARDRNDDVQRGYLAADNELIYSDMIPDSPLPATLNKPVIASQSASRRKAKQSVAI